MNVRPQGGLEGQIPRDPGGGLVDAAENVVGEGDFRIRQTRS
jgi:hypothetical protein